MRRFKSDSAIRQPRAQAEAQRRYEAQRAQDGGRAMYQTETWRKLRAAVLRADPWCRHCMLRGSHTPATVVDHIVPHRGDPELFINEENLQPLCKQCHDRKTVRFDGGFGRSPARTPGVGQK